MKQGSIVALFAVSLLASGCNSNVDPPLVFVQTTSLGVSASSTGAQATPELTVGYRDVDVALVPVTRDGHLIKSTNPSGNGQTFTDSLSVLGQFEVNASGGATPSTSLG